MFFSNCAVKKGGRVTFCNVGVPRIFFGNYWAVADPYCLFMWPAHDHKKTIDNE